MSDNFRIRPARAEDSDRLAVLAVPVWLHTYTTDGINDLAAQYVLSELTPDKYARSLSDPANHFLLAESDQNLLGFSVVEFGAACPNAERSSAELRTLYVQEHHVGRGVGKALLQAAEAKARQHCGTALWLKVNARNARAVAFYAHQGYTKVGTTYFVLGEGRHENHVLLGADW